MKKKSQQRSSVSHQQGRYTSNDFYSSGASEEKPLYEDRKMSASMASASRKTGRHYNSKRADAVDERDKAALIAILKLGIVALLLLIVFVALWKGIGLYEKSMMLENKMALEAVEENAAVVVTKNGFNIEDPDSRATFAGRIKQWRKADRIVRSADSFIQQSIMEQAIARCNDALALDGSHSGALSRLGQLYFEQGNYRDSVNVYVRLLNVDPSNLEVQKKLIQALDAYGDSAAVSAVAAWYLEENLFDADVQRYLANALFSEERYEESIAAYKRVLREKSKDLDALHRMATAQLILEKYDDALESFLTLRTADYETPEYHRFVAVCRAQLNRPKETVNALGRAVQLFGENVVTSWIKDPRMNVVREDRAFQAFTDRVAGEEFRRFQERMAKSMNQRDEQANVKLELPSFEKEQSLILRDKNVKPQR